MKKIVNFHAMNAQALAQAFKQHIEQLLTNRRKYIQQRNEEIQNFVKQLQTQEKQAPLTEDVLEEFQGIITKYSLHLRTIRAGTQLSDFKILKFLGKGAFSTVYLVQHKETGQKYALKRISKEIFLSGSIGWLRAQAERAVLLAFQSKYIAQLSYSFQDDRYLYFVMTYAAGGDLQCLLDQCGLLPLSWVRRWFAQMVCAVCTLHGMNIEEALGVQQIQQYNDEQNKAQRQLQQNLTENNIHSQSDNLCNSKINQHNINSKQLINEQKQEQSNQCNRLGVFSKAQQHLLLNNTILSDQELQNNSFQQLNNSLICTTKNNSFDADPNQMNSNIHSLNNNSNTNSKINNLQNDSLNLSSITDNNLIQHRNVKSTDPQIVNNSNTEANNSTSDSAKFINIGQTIMKCQTSRFQQPQQIHDLQEISSFDNIVSDNKESVSLNTQHLEQILNDTINIQNINLSQYNTEEKAQEQESNKLRLSYSEQNCQQTKSKLQFEENNSNNLLSCDSLASKFHVIKDQLKNKTETIAKELHKSYQQLENRIDGFAHRDLKPNNFLIDESGKIILADFGFAQQIHRANILASTYGMQSNYNCSKIFKSKNQDSIEQTAVGTLQYMAPEIFKNGETGKSVDFWALGCILFEMLTGTIAFPIQSPESHIKYFIETPWDQIKPQQIPEYELLPKYARNLIEGLLSPPEQRLGYYGNDLQLIKHEFFTQNVPIEQIISLAHPLLQKLHREQQATEDEWENLPLLPLESLLLIIQNPWKPMIGEAKESLEDDNNMQLSDKSELIVIDSEEQVTSECQSLTHHKQQQPEIQRSSMTASETSNLETSFSTSSYIQLQLQEKYESSIRSDQNEKYEEQYQNQHNKILIADYISIDQYNISPIDKNNDSQQNSTHLEDQSFKQKQINQKVIVSMTKNESNKNPESRRNNRRFSMYNRSSILNELPGMNYVCDTISQQKQELHTKCFLKQRRHSFSIRNSIEQTLQHEKDKLFRQYTIDRVENKNGLFKDFILD